MKYLISTICALTMICGQAVTLRQLFASEPDNIFMLLPKSTRLDMLDYYDAGQKVAANNNLSGDSTVTQLISLSDNSISLHLTATNDITLRLLTLPGRDTVIAVVSTALLPAPDSNLAFYNTRWQRIDTKRLFTQPTLDDLCRHDAPKDSLQLLRQAIPFTTAQYTISDTDPCQITIRHSLGQLLSHDDWAMLKPLLRDSIVYTLQGKKFKPAK